MLSPAADVSGMSTPTLRDELSSRSLDSTGPRCDLVHRLTAALQSYGDSNCYSGDSVAESENVITNEQLEKDEEKHEDISYCNYCDMKFTESQVYCEHIHSLNHIQNVEKVQNAESSWPEEVDRSPSGPVAGWLSSDPVESDYAYENPTNDDTNQEIVDSNDGMLDEVIDQEIVNTTEDLSHNVIDHEMVDTSVDLEDDAIYQEVVDNDTTENLTDELLDQEVVDATGGLTEDVTNQEVVNAKENLAYEVLNPEVIDTTGSLTGVGKEATDQDGVDATEGLMDEVTDHEKVNATGDLKHDVIDQELVEATTKLGKESVDRTDYFVFIDENVIEHGKEQEMHCEETDDNVIEHEMEQTMDCEGAVEGVEQKVEDDGVKSTEEDCTIVMEEKVKNKLPAGESYVDLVADDDDDDEDKDLDMSCCKICDMAFKKEAAYHIHIRSISHIQKMGRIENDNSSWPVNSTPHPIEYKPGAKSGTIKIPPKEKASKLPPKETSMKQEAVKSVTTNDTQFCHVCDFQFSCIELFNSHLDGLVHQQKLEEKQINPQGDVAGAAEDNSHAEYEEEGYENDIYEYEEDTNNIICRVCDLTCTGEISMDFHLKGKQHAKALKKLQLVEDIVANKVSCEGSKGKKAEKQAAMKDKPADVKSDKLADEKKKKIAKTSRIQPVLDKNRHQQLIGLDYMIEYQSVDPKVEPRYVCDLCESKMDGEQVVNHLTSLRHRTKFFKKHFTSMFDALSFVKDKEEKISLASKFAGTVVQMQGERWVRVKIQHKPFQNDAVSASTDDRTRPLPSVSQFTQNQRMNMPIGPPHNYYPQPTFGPPNNFGFFPRGPPLPYNRFGQPQGMMPPQPGMMPPPPGNFQMFPQPNYFPMYPPMGDGLLPPPNNFPMYPPMGDGLLPPPNNFPMMVPPSNISSVSNPATSSSTQDSNSSTSSNNQSKNSSASKPVTKGFWPSVVGPMPSIRAKLAMQANANKNIVDSLKSNKIDNHPTRSGQELVAHRRQSDGRSSPSNDNDSPMVCVRRETYTEVTKGDSGKKQERRIEVEMKTRTSARDSRWDKLSNDDKSDRRLGTRKYSQFLPSRTSRRSRSPDRRGRRRSPTPDRRKRSPSPARRRRSPSLDHRRRRSPTPERRKRSPSREGWNETDSRMLKVRKNHSETPERVEDGLSRIEVLQRHLLGRRAQERQEVLRGGGQYSTEESYVDQLQGLMRRDPRVEYDARGRGMLDERESPVRRGPIRELEAPPVTVDLASSLSTARASMDFIKTALARFNVNSNSDSEIALQISNVLTRALLEWRIKYTATSNRNDTALSQQLRNLETLNATGIDKKRQAQLAMESPIMHAALSEVRTLAELLSSTGDRMMMQQVLAVLNSVNQQLYGMLATGPPSGPDLTTGPELPMRNETGVERSSYRQENSAPMMPRINRQREELPVYDDYTQAPHYTSYNNYRS